MIHHNLSQPIVHIDSREHWSSRQRVNGFVHQGMALYEANDFIGKISGRFYKWIIGFAWALKERDQEVGKSSREEIQQICSFSVCITEKIDRKAVYSF